LGGSNVFYFYFFSGLWYQVFDWYVEKAGIGPRADGGSAGRGAQEGRGSGTREIGHLHPEAAGFGEAPDLTPEEHQLRRGDAIDAIFREIKRKIAAGSRERLPAAAPRQNDPPGLTVARIKPKA
jgi:hypothetical protein